MAGFLFGIPCPVDTWRIPRRPMLCQFVHGGILLPTMNEMQMRQVSIRLSIVVDGLHLVFILRRQQKAYSPLWDHRIPGRWVL